MTISWYILEYVPKAGHIFMLIVYLMEGLWTKHAATAPLFGFNYMSSKDWIANGSEGNCSHNLHSEHNAYHCS